MFEKMALNWVLSADAPPLEFLVHPDIAPRPRSGPGSRGGRGAYRGRGSRGRGRGRGRGRKRGRSNQQANLDIQPKSVGGKRGAQQALTAQLLSVWNAATAPKVGHCPRSPRRDDDGPGVGTQRTIR